MNDLYVESEFDSLLQEKEYIVDEREKLRKEISILKECLDLINGIESKITM